VKRTAQAQVHLVDDPASLQALSHPLRLRILDELRAPASAATLARALDQSRQNVNYHLKELERTGLVRRVEERRRGNFVETLFQTVAATIVVSPRAAWGDERRIDALHEQLSLEHLVTLGERLGRDAAILLDRAAFDGEQIASAAIETEVHLADEASRAAFVRDYFAAVAPVLRAHGTKDGTAYRVAVAVYPDPDPTPRGSEP
jgi:DNA-binding transcriptional ArsR family regulator